MMILSAIAIASLALPVSRARSLFEQRCALFAPETHVHNSTRTVLQYVPAGSNLAFPDNDPTCHREGQVVPVDMCRVALSIPTSNRSSITYEMWMPKSWTGRTLATGNGGLDGCIAYEDLAYGVANGFATVGANNGHNGTHGDAFYKNEDVVIDFAWRSLHTSAVAAKKLAPLFYGGEEVGKSYYLGCSRGGGQGIKAAEMFPEDFDGILAGAPAVDFVNLYSWRASFFPLTGAAGSGDFISAGVWNATVHDEVLRQCDGIDGVLDGIIEDPTLCRFQPDALLCSAARDVSSSSTTTTTSSSCLTAAQVQIVEAIFADYTWPNGSLLFPAMQPGSEVLAASGLYSGAPFPLSQDWFRFAVLEDPGWDASTYGVDDALLAAEKNPGGARTWPSSLSGFERRGGRILTYHGLQDQQITSYNSIRFYEHLLASSNSNSNSSNSSAAAAAAAASAQEKMDRFHRFFRIPGMSHCGGGPGAWVLGQKGGAAAAGIAFDAGHNLLAALVAWVEDGAAPETITGTKFVGDDVARGVAYRHRHCRYPSRSTYLGCGLDPLEELSWTCV